MGFPLGIPAQSRPSGGGRADHAVDISHLAAVERENAQLRNRIEQLEHALDEYRVTIEHYRLSLACANARLRDRS